MRAVLTVNAGSSSLKFAVFATKGGGAEELVRGQVEGLGARPRIAARGGGGEIRVERALDEDADHRAGLREVLALVRGHLPGAEIAAVGHRVVHGGPEFAEPMAVDDALLDRLARYVPLAPLHQPHNLAGIHAARAAFPDAAQVACFDTAFHRGHPWVDDTFALPRELYDQGVRRYGFHGLSYEYVSQELERIAPLHAAGRVVIAHLGNGASMCAVRGGQSVGSTMGFSALDGLPMGTRCGQLDPGVLLWLMTEKGMTAAEISDLLYHRSGLKGLSGISHDMRVLGDAGTPEAIQAVEYFVFRIRRELGAMAAVLGGLDAVVFCGGIGENDHRVREKVCAGFEWMGVELDPARNRAAETVVSTDRSRARVFVVRTDEERMIARHAVAVVGG